ncbi:MAG: hypothetical protein JWM36_2712 [Hyphomicrobiales bacterium]|nr:hypothetical protein [Hyphomicrobiales bacterium]
MLGSDSGQPCSGNGPKPVNGLLLGLQVEPLASVESRGRPSSTMARNGSIANPRRRTGRADPYSCVAVAEAIARMALTPLA